MNMDKQIIRQMDEILTGNINGAVYSITHKSEVQREDGEWDYEHVTVAKNVDRRTIAMFKASVNDNAYQYYVTEWDDEDIVEQTNLDEFNCH